LSDQTEKPKGALPKGYESNAQGESQDQDKKIWDKYYNGEIELPDVVKELKHYRNSKDTELETSDEDQREKDLKGYEPNAQGEPLDQDKKIWDKYYNGEIELPNVVKELKHYKEPKAKPIKPSNLKSGVDTGTLTLLQYINAKRKTKQDEIKKYEQKYLSRYKQPKTKKNVGSDLYKPEIPKPKLDMKKERKKYEQKYLSRYKQPKSKPTKSSNLKHDTDLGTLTLGQYVNAKRKTKQNEIREYEKQYLSRYREPKPKKRAIQVEWKPEPKQDIKKERKDYENEFLTRYKKQQKAKPKKKVSKLLMPEPKTDRKKERKEYENEFLTRYKKQQKAKPKKNVSKLLTPEPKIDRKKERKE